MTTPTFSIPVDLHNPGQFFACCGILELAHILDPDCLGWFTDNLFHIASQIIQLEDVLSLLSGAKGNTNDSSDKLAPIQLEGSFSFRLDWWLDRKGEKSDLKLWAGQQSSHNIVTNLLDAIAGRESCSDQRESTSLFEQGLFMSSTFGIDPRSAWQAIDIGFSPNTQNMEVTAFPFVEILGAVGLQGFRPCAGAKKRFCFSTWGIPLPVSIARAVSVGAIPGVVEQQFCFPLAKRGQFRCFDYAKEVRSVQDE